MTERLDNLETVIGYRFRNRGILLGAVTHGSSGEKQRSLINERLEYLGDAVVGLAVAGRLFREFPDDTEGDLSAKRAKLASRNALAGVAASIGLDEHIRLGKGQEKTGGRENPTILADLFEAVLGAVAADGGTERAMHLAEDLIFRNAAAVLADDKYTNYKSRLLERCQEISGTKPVYELTGTSGPDHRQEFRIRVTINGATAGTGNGPNKKQAEQMAARAALNTISSKPIGG